ncbi:Hypothetical predicted protein [Mytilus galloprovincialis]|uniref:Uncharacterized protein n=1 Tax=Mytilus galloprovincialis TaxID=29158 RepID=A0A8B6G016_MYTGA|nr:Hypothetical predicted protein [Mytilus galloprovincialis]
MSQPKIGYNAKEEDFKHQADEGLSINIVQTKHNEMNDLKLPDKFDKETLTNSEEDLEKAIPLFKISQSSIEHIAEEKNLELEADNLKLPASFDKETPTNPKEELQIDFDLLAKKASEVFDQKKPDRIIVPGTCFVLKS